MTQPKLREGAYELMLSKSRELIKDSNELISGVNWKDECFTPNDMQQVSFIVGAEWALRNLHLLLEPRDQPLVNGKRVAIVEVGE